MPGMIGDARSEADDRLERLGASSDVLDVEQRRRLDWHGYVLVPSVLDRASLERLRARLDELVAEEGALAGVDLQSWSTDTRLVSNLVDKGDEFVRLCTHPLPLAAARHVLRRPFKLSSLNAREPLPGRGRQALHADWAGAREPGATHVLNAIWAIDDFTAANGGTRLVPGTHRLAGAIGEHVRDPVADHPLQVAIACPAGSVLVFNAHCWHGGTANGAGARRRAINAYFVAREHPQQTPQRERIGAATAARLTPDQRWLLDLDQPPTGT